MKKENSQKVGWKEFFKLSIWKVILTIIASFITFLFLGPYSECIEEFKVDGGSFNCTYFAPIGIENTKILGAIFLIIFYLIFSLMELIFRGIKNVTEK